METTVSQQNTDQEKEAVVVTWVILGLSWLFLLITGLGWLGWMFSFVAFILSIVVLSKGNTGTGVLLLILVGLGAAANSQAFIPAIAGFPC